MTNIESGSNQTDNEKNQSSNQQSTDYEPNFDDNEVIDLTQPAPSENADSASSGSESDKNTLQQNLQRFWMQGHLRLILMAGTAFIIFLGVVTLRACSSKELPTTASGEIANPTTSAKGTATYTPEQAEYARQRQIMEAQQAQAQGNSYIAPALVTRDLNPQNLGDPTQPGAYNPNAAGVQGGLSNAQMNQAVGAPPTGANGQPQMVMNSQGQLVPQTDIPANATGSANPAQSTQAGQQAAPVSPNAVEEQQLDAAEQRVQQWQQTVQQQQITARDTRLKQIDEGFAGQMTSLTGGDGRNARASDAVIRTKYYSYPEADTANGQDGTIANSKGAVGSRGSVDSNTAANLKKLGLSDGAGTDGGEQGGKVLYRAGTEFTARLLNEVNTDQGNDVHAELLTGPHRGSMITGKVQPTTSDIQFNFDRLLPKDNGPAIKLNATARRIGNKQLGMADSINKHTISRYSALIASSALQGYGQAYQQTMQAQQSVLPNGTTIVSSEDPSNKRIVGNIVGNVGSAAANEVGRGQNRPTTYIANANKVFSVFINQDVIEATGK